MKLNYPRSGRSNKVRCENIVLLELLRFKSKKNGCGLRLKESGL